MNRLLLPCVLLVASLQLSANDIHQECYRLLDQEKYQEAFVLALTTLNEQDQEVISEAYYIMGYARRKQNYFSEALHYYERSIEKTADPDKKGKVLNNVISTLQYTSLHEQAIKEADRAIALSEKWRVVSIFNKAYSLRVLKDFTAAIQTLDEGVRICKAEQNVVFILKLWNLQAEIQIEMGNYLKAQQLLETVVNEGQIAPKKGKPYKKSRAVEIGKAKHQLGLLHLAQADTAQAFARFEESLAIQTDEHERFYSLLEIARIAQDKEPFVRAALELYPSLTLTEKTLKVFFLASARGLADLAMFEREFDKYVKQENSTKETYVAYIGRQILKEQQLLERDAERRTWNLLIGALLVLVVSGGLVLYMKSTR